MKRKYRVGEKYNLLTIVDQWWEDNGRCYAKAECECGGIKQRVVLDSVVRGTTQSCGCLEKENRIKHNLCKSSEYTVFYGITQRCDNPNNAHFSNYGGRGIRCEWQSFEDFYADMGQKPTDTSTIERTDVNGNYCKENCVWEVDRGKQGYNTRLRKDNSSGRCGVYMHSQMVGKWTAEIRKDKKKIYLGTFNSFEEACKAREEAELKYYGFTKET